MFHVSEVVRNKAHISGTHTHTQTHTFTFTLFHPPLGSQQHYNIRAAPIWGAQQCLCFGSFPRLCKALTVTGFTQKPTSEKVDPSGWELWWQTAKFFFFFGGIRRGRVVSQLPGINIPSNQIICCSTFRPTLSDSRRGCECESEWLLVSLGLR